MLFKSWSLESMEGRHRLAGFCTVWATNRLTELKTGFIYNTERLLRCGREWILWSFFYSLFLLASSLIFQFRHQLFINCCGGRGEIISCCEYEL